MEAILDHPFFQTVSAKKEVLEEFCSDVQMPIPLAAAFRADRLIAKDYSFVDVVYSTANGRHSVRDFADALA